MGLMAAYRRCGEEVDVDVDASGDAALRVFIELMSHSSVKGGGFGDSSSCCCCSGPVVLVVDTSCFMLLSLGRLLPLYTGSGSRCTADGDADRGGLGIGVYVSSLLTYIAVLGREEAGPCTCTYTARGPVSGVLDVETAAFARSLFLSLSLCMFVGVFVFAFALLPEPVWDVDAPPPPSVRCGWEHWVWVCDAGARGPRGGNA